jgi:hypothetical protein
MSDHLEKLEEEITTARRCAKYALENRPHGTSPLETARLHAVFSGLCTASGCLTVLREMMAAVAEEAQVIAPKSTEN